jgi:biotin carboxylase
MNYKVLMVGRSKAFIPALEKVAPDLEIYLLEEPELRQHHHKNPLNSAIIKEIRNGTYQQSYGLLETAQKWHQEVNFDVVVPGIEYAVVGAGLVAKDLGLKYLGEKAVRHLTNKLHLRELCQKSGIGHPRFQKIKSVADVRNFFQGKTIVIKPANRQASTGVIKVEKESDIESAYTEMMAADEGHRVVNRPMQWEFLAEEYMSGLEVSVETIVQNGKAIFHNITEKKTTESLYFVELGHVVPARLDSQQTEIMYASQEKLVAALSAQDGFLHAEWKITDEGPKLIECAGRVAGDRILDLIELAYGFNVYEAIIKTLAGEPISLPQQPTNGACIQYFEPPLGVLQEVRGIDALKSANSALIDWSLTVKPGDAIAPFTSSWSRVGYVMTAGKTNNDACSQADKYAKSVAFIVEKD